MVELLNQAALMATEEKLTVLKQVCVANICPSSSLPLIYTGGSEDEDDSVGPLDPKYPSLAIARPSSILD